MKLNCNLLKTIPPIEDVFCITLRYKKPFSLLFKYSFFLLQILYFSDALIAQSNIPVGTWKFHQSYKDPGMLTGSDRTVFYQGKESIFYFSTQDFIPKSITKNQGLYGQSFVSSAFDEVSKTFIVAYPDGTLDKISEKNIESIIGLRENYQIQNKKINAIKLINNTFYLAADFGLSAINPETGRFMDAFLNIGPEGSLLEIMDISDDAQSFYLATLKGIFKGDKKVNLKDFRNWQLLENSAKGFTEAESLDGRLFFLGTDQQLYVLNENKLELIFGTSGSENLKKIGKSGYFFKDQAIYKLEPSGSFALLLETGEEPISDYHIAGNNIYLSITGRGVVRQSDQKEIFAPGPHTKIQQFHWDEKGTYGLPLYMPVQGNMKTSDGNKASFLENGIWKTIEAPSDIIAKADFQNNQYYGTQSNGLWKTDGNQTKKIDLKNVRQGENVRSFVKDNKNQLWIGFNDNQESLLKIDASGALQLIPVPGLQFPYKMIVDNADNLFILQSLPTGITRLQIFNESTNLNRQVLLSTLGIPSGQILAMDLDLEDNLWLGLNNGLIYLPQISRINASSQINAIQPLFENRNLLQGQIVKSVKIAPDNSKWFGTENEGLWHFSEFTDVLLEHFIRENSPLSSNEIRNLEVDPVSGELLIVLPNAAIAYRSNAIRAAPELAELKIFPNPVRPDFSGLLSIEGLTDFVTVKITNAAGRVVFSARIRGGKITWNLRSGQSGKISPGVYLVYVMGENGAEKVAGKFVVL